MDEQIYISFTNISLVCAQNTLLGADHVENTPALTHKKKLLIYVFSLHPSLLSNYITNTTPFIVIDKHQSLETLPLQNRDWYHSHTFLSASRRITTFCCCC